MYPRAIAGAVAAACLLLAIAFSAARTAPVATPTPSPDPASAAAVAAFLRAHTVASPVAPDRFAWLLSDVTGTVILPEDEKVPATVLGNVGRPQVSPAARHLYYWTYEARGIRQLHVFDTVTLAPPQVVLETELFTKLAPLWSVDEQFVAFPIPERPVQTRIVDLVTRASIEGDSGSIAAHPIWASAGGIVPADPGTSMPRVISKFARPDGSATTYLDFDSSAGGRWFGERVDIATGKRTPVEWSFGGNPEGVIRVGARPAETVRYDQAPPRDPSGKISIDGALWSFRQSVGSAIRREAIRAMPYSEWVASSGSRSYSVPLDLVVYVVVIEVEDPQYFARGNLSCRELFALLRSDGNGPGTGGGCMGNTWPANLLPPAFATPDARDWTSPKGPPTPGPSTTPSIRR